MSVANPRDQISIQSQSILWVAGVGVGLLTLAFVLGVQVGKQSAALRRPMQKGVEEELKELPEPLVDQLKIFEGDGPDKLVPTQKVEAAAPKGDAKPEAKAEAKPQEKPAEPEAWTLQLVATAEAAEAKRVADKAKAAGFATTTVKEKGQLKVRLTKATDRAAADKTAEKLKKAGFKPFAVKVE
ncbi:MAG: SPOR domain-containing protein [Holophagaceae bacterium]